MDDLKVGDILLGKGACTQRNQLKLLGIFPMFFVVAWIETATKDMSPFLVDGNFIEKNFNIPKKKWKPNNGEKFFIVCGDGSISSAQGTFSRNYSEIGNCFKTEKEAEVFADKFRELLK